MECSKQKQLFQIRIIRNSTFVDVSLCKYELLLADYNGLCRLEECHSLYILQKCFAIIFTKDRYQYSIH